MNKLSVNHTQHDPAPSSFQVNLWFSKGFVPAYVWMQLWDGAWDCNSQGPQDISSCIHSLLVPESYKCKPHARAQRYFSQAYGYVLHGSCSTTEIAPRALPTCFWSTIGLTVLCLNACKLLRSEIVCFQMSFPTLQFNKNFNIQKKIEGGKGGS